MKNSKLRFGDYITVVCTLINNLLIIVLYRHGINCVITKVKYIVELKDRVLAPWGPSSISAEAELVSKIKSDHKFFFLQGTLNGFRFFLGLRR